MKPEFCGETFAFQMIGNSNLELNLFSLLENSYCYAVFFIEQPNRIASNRITNRQTAFNFKIPKDERSVLVISHLCIGNANLA